MAQTPREATAKSTAQPAAESDKSKAGGDVRREGNPPGVAGARAPQEGSGQSEGRAGLATEKPPYHVEAAPKSVGASRSPALESPPPQSSPPKSTSLYVVAVDDSTGLATKIEKLNEQTGERKELSSSEYAQVAAYSAMGALPMAAAASGNAFVQAYMQGIADFFKNTRGTP